MNYKCPLCLRSLTGTDKLTFACATHSASGQLDWNERDFAAKSFCPKHRSCNDDISEGIFLSHLGCPALNPFWNAASKKIEVPGDPRSSSITHQLNTTGGARSAKIRHWEIAALRCLPGNVKEMWFPLMLLRATAEKDKDGRIGAFVELCGAQAAGKTIIALQAMDVQGYVKPSDDTRNVRVEDYIYSRRPAGAPDNPLLEILYLRGLMRRNEAEVFLPQGTRREPGDLKVVFLKPSPPSEGPVPAQPRRRSAIKEFTKELRKEIVAISREFASDSRVDPYWFTVAFYDTAGEAWEDEDVMPDLRALDKVAIVVDARDVIGASGANGKSLKVANSRIPRINDRANSCLVITQVDRVMDQLPEKECQLIERMAEDLDQIYEAESRNMLKGWLNRTPNPDKQELINHLRQVGNIFFVWTVNLPSGSKMGPKASEAPAPNAGQTVWQPASYGLAKFICWCLGVRWKAINQKHAGY